MAWRRYCCGEVLPFLAMVIVEGVFVGLNTLFKTASLKGMSYYVFIVYSFATATLFLLPFAFFSHRGSGLPPLKISTFLKICLLGLFGFLAQIFGFKGIEYSSPTLASATSNLIPAFTFVLAIFFQGPVYIALFKPFAIVIAAVTGFIFLGERLYLGSVVGAVVISVGFYVVMWGKAKEEMGEEFGVMNSLESPSTLKAPLLGEER
ncbi:nodulin MtN21 /EamA-like transporter family protein [Actinidia rufa]|uniref:WAT1-related protein n=1 Tax=Actinidia rufa TaxID=165716 RepID=A0A7J0EKT8_9ERIC|nr:nodulin MtN21 /EamA-like transporter family protein [Actinidia rufa]